MKNLFILIFTSLFVFSCSSNTEKTKKSVAEVVKAKPNNFKISGSIAGGQGQTIYLMAQTEQGRITAAKALIEPSGSFIMENYLPGYGIYELHLGESQQNAIIIVLQPADDLQIVSTASEFSKSTLFSNTSWSKQLNGFYASMKAYIEVQEVMATNASLTNKQKDSSSAKAMIPMENFARKAINEDPGNKANIVLMSSLFPQDVSKLKDENLVVLKKMMAAYVEQDQNSIITQQVVSQIQDLETRFMASKETANGSMMAPDFSLPNVNGKMISLESLRGQVVLIDFWASWCRPCRAANPEVVAIYNKYKNKGFTVLSVSLDSDATAWKNAIQADGLIWPNHVSDLKQWQTPMVQLYNFNSIPHTVLINKKGKIIGQDLRGESLERKLTSAL